MSEPGLFIGSRVRLTSLKDVDVDSRCSVTHKPPKGKVYVAVVIGVETKDPQSDDEIIETEEAVKRLRNIIEQKDQDSLPGTISSASGIRDEQHRTVNKIPAKDRNNWE